ncbi:MAG: response regulator transcription factor [Butyrivibrio sp.]|jgi:two-component system KDP operon response regulator KdpE|nr:response regulator transcription factor [Butyrivibrio sp.]
MSKLPLILIVEDDRPVRSLISMALKSRGYQQEAVSNGQEAVLAMTGHPPDILILDLGLPDMDGNDIIKMVREWSQLPIIVVSARSDERDKIDALDYGADDYLTKPFSVEELLARIRVAVRRLQYIHENQESSSSVFTNGKLSIDYNAGLVMIDKEEIHLTPIEYKLLCVMAQNVGRVLTHNFILKEVWNNTLPNDTQSLRVYMASLRTKVEPLIGEKVIQTHVGIGYRMIKL